PLTRPIETECLTDLAGGECRAVLQNAIVSIHGVVGVPFGLPPTHRVGKQARAIDIHADVVALNQITCYAAAGDEDAASNIAADHVTGRAHGAADGVVMRMIGDVDAGGSIGP